jgi:hypothetical protein
MHLDGCHFFAWVRETTDGGSELTWYERTGGDLYLHSDSDCDRCRELSGGAKPREHRANITLPEGPKEAFLAVLSALAEMEQSGVGVEGERP